EDLIDMEKVTGLSREEIVKIHSGTDYRVYMLGFLPGFAYLGGLDERIAAPRLKTPRLSIPAGSVAIGGNQTGVYPIASPGGWRIIGSTPIEFYNPNREEPILCKAGDYIRFVPIGEDEYDEIREHPEAWA
ncbi:MAG: 5-oxoprolinase subunit PxpB, partial [Schwartzia sp.]|nr:5-oxoprolinase subunit PxpB [Schwartzia sp. (in: firmicutes)]